MAYHDPSIPSAEVLLDRIPTVLEKHGITFSKTEGALLVGGEARLLWLIRHGKIRVERPCKKQNGKWFCSAADVIKYVRLR